MTIGGSRRDKGDNMEEVMGNPTDEETPVAEEEEAMADDDMM